MPTPDRPFWQQLTEEVLSSSFQCLQGNTDTWRFRTPSLRQRSRGQLLRAAAVFGLFRPPRNYLARIREVAEAGDFDWILQHLADDVSRELLVKLMAFRILGSLRYRLPVNTPSYWHLRNSISRYTRTRAKINGVPNLVSLDEFEYEGIRLIAHPLNILNTFVLEQYKCDRANIGVRQGDIVIDGGACWGDTSLYFARRAERVFACECVPYNLSIFQQNMDLNHGLASKITLIRRALWKTSDETLFFSDNGPGSRAGVDATRLQVETQSVDNLVMEHNLKRVDFIKLDIEGAEMDALLGAEETIRRFRPRLAISVYHNIHDFIRVPEWISNLGLGYRMYLDHFTIHKEESVLFSESDNN